MAVRLVNVDRNTPMLLPPDLRDCLPEDPIARFIVDAVETLPREGKPHPAPVGSDSSFNPKNENQQD